MNILITICGREGSKGLKNKNVRFFLDKPLVYYSIAAALDFSSKLSNDTVTICLNTDSHGLKNLVVTKYPEVICIKRPDDLTGETVPKLAVYKHSLEYMEALTNTFFDYLIDLDITSPLRQEKDILNAYNKKKRYPSAELVFSVCHSRRNPYFNMVKEKNGYAEQVVKSLYTSRQQTPAIYDMNASIYIFNTEFLRKKNNTMILESKCMTYLMKDTAVLDIDSEDDFKLMEIIADYLYKTMPSYAKIKNIIRT